MKKEYYKNTFSTITLFLLIICVLFFYSGNDSLYPGRNKDGSIETLLNPNLDAALSTDSDSRSNFVYNRYHHLPIETQRQKLPVFQYRNHILYLLEKYQSLILIGETGCGKSTQVPQVSLFYICNSSRVTYERIECISAAKQYKKCYCQCCGQLCRFLPKAHNLLCCWVFNYI